MSKIGFLTDSCSDIPQELADKYGIEVVGFPINLDGTEYVERKDFTNDQFYEMMRKAQGGPTTAAITQLQWCEIYERYVDEGYTDLVHLSINAAGSSTYNNAIKGAEMLAEERPDHKLKIQIIDSHTYSMPYGWYFCECARKVRNGGELSTCVDELKRKLDCVEICLAAYSLKQMKKSGRVSAAAAVVGDLLGIRPIISLNAGVSKVEAKGRGDAAVEAAGTLPRTYLYLRQQDGPARGGCRRAPTGAAWAVRGWLCGFHHRAGPRGPGPVQRTTDGGSAGGRPA